MCFCFCLVFSNRWQNDLLFYCLKLFCLFAFIRQQFLICLSFVFTGSPVSFENAILYDQVYQQTLAAVMFIVWLDMLKPLTFNSHLHILYFSLTKGRKEMLSFMLFFLIAISAFASYLNVTDGYVVYDFRSPITSVLTMLQILLAMISLRKHPELSSLHSQIVISVFAFVMTFVFINFFISMLNCYFSNGKESLTKSGDFCQELNEHFWKRVNQLFSKIWKSLTYHIAQSPGMIIFLLIKSFRIILEYYVTPGLKKKISEPTIPNEV